MTGISGNSFNTVGKPFQVTTSQKSKKQRVAKGGGCIYNVESSENKGKPLHEKVCPNFWLCSNSYFYMTKMIRELRWMGSNTILQFHTAAKATLLISLKVQQPKQFYWHTAKVKIKICLNNSHRHTSTLLWSHTFLRFVLSYLSVALLCGNVYLILEKLFCFTVHYLCPVSPEDFVLAAWK